MLKIKIKTFSNHRVYIPDVIIRIHDSINYIFNFMKVSNFKTDRNLKINFFMITVLFQYANSHMIK